MKKASGWPKKFVSCKHKTPKELKKKVYAHQVDDALSFGNDEAPISSIKKFICSKTHPVRL